MAEIKETRQIRRRDPKPATGSIVVKQSIETTLTCGGCGLKETIKVNNQGDNFSILVDKWNAEHSIFGWEISPRIICQTCAFKAYQAREAANG